MVKPATKGLKMEKNHPKNVTTLVKLYKSKKSKTPTHITMMLERVLLLNRLRRLFFIRYSMVSPMAAIFLWKSASSLTTKMGLVKSKAYMPI